MVTTKTISLYTFDELSDKAKEKARDWFREACAYDEWWESTYEDAANTGLKITGFDDVYRGSCKGHFLQSAGYTAQQIIENHGKDCETHKTALKYLDKIELLKATHPNVDSYDFDQEIIQEDKELLHSLLEDYRIMLQKEYEFQTSDETVDDNIRANVYSFRENGKRED